MGVFTNSFSEETWYQKYKDAKDSDVLGSWKRVAKDLASVEDDKEKWENIFYEALYNFKFVPGGRITSNAGTKLGGTTMINCFCDGFLGKDLDSIEGIYGTLLKQAQILKSEGGYGFCANVMRPCGSHIGGIANQSPGAVKFLELWDKSSEIITSGSGKQARKDQKNFIRKGAQMVTMSCWHPDVVEFINAKKTAGRLSKFNMSVLCTDSFMQAINLDLPWDLKFPNYEKFPKAYKEIWDGDINKWEQHLIDEEDATLIHHTFESSRELWDLIMDNTYNRNEPGVLFVDTMNRMNNLNYCEYIQQTNPCIAKGSLVNTPDGYRKVEDINEGDHVCTILGNEPVKSIETHSDCPVFKITFSDGSEQIVTAAHRYHVSRKGSGSKKIEKVRVNEINIGDKVRVSACEFWDDEYAGGEYEEGEYLYGLRAGVLLGDGCYTQHCMKQKVVKIATSQDDVEYNELVQNYLFFDEHFNKGYEDKNSKSMTMILSYKRYLESCPSEPCLEDLGLTTGQKAHEKTIEYSRISNPSFSMGFLDGLLATDGNVNLKSNHPQLRWMTTSPELAQTVRNVLLYMGCHGFINSSFDDGGIIDGRQIKRNHAKYTVTISGESFKNYAQKTGLGKLHPQKYSRIKKALTDFRLSGNRWCTEVQSIEPCGTADVYDLYCAESDTWITSGYVQQGCGEQILPIGGVCLLGSI